MTYSIIRIYHPDLNKQSRIIKKGLSLEEAQAHCEDPRTSTDDWFDGFEREEQEDYLWQSYQKLKVALPQMGT